ncbi:MAG: acyltransferase [Cyanobacteria bacterium]|nr:acyltransferase [Cyanobacteriota bacterium]
MRFGHIPALDGLRGVAIILVLLHHLTIHRPTSGIDEWIASVPLFGWSGVDVFFVLSGFLITGILIDARGSDRYFTNFYARRTLRIFPLYYLVVFLALHVLPLLPRLHEVIVGPYPIPPRWAYWTYLTNFSVADRGFVHGWLDVAWSLAIEEQFYLLWAPLVFLCAPRFLWLVCAAIIISEPIARNIAVSRAADTTAVYVQTWFRLDGLATGALIAWLVRRDWLPVLAQWAPTVAIAGLAGMVMVVIDGGDAWWWQPSMQRVGYSLIAITSGALLVMALQPQGLWTRMMSAGWLRAFGKYSYCLYLIHLPVMRVIREYAFDPADYPMLAPWIGQALFYVIATAPAFGLAWLSWRVFEAPILKLKSRFAQ